MISITPTTLCLFPLLHLRLLSNSLPIVAATNLPLPCPISFCDNSTIKPLARTVEDTWLLFFINACLITKSTFLVNVLKEGFIAFVHFFTSLCIILKLFEIYKHVWSFIFQAMSFYFSSQSFVHPLFLNIYLFF